MRSLFIFFLFFPFFAKCEQLTSTPRQQLQLEFERHCCESSDISEHVSLLRDLARECSTVVEIGLRSMNSSWGILQGLAESAENIKSYLGIDIANPPFPILHKARSLSESVGIRFRFWKANDMNIDIEEVDMLFIDSLHTYCHLTYELEKFSPKIKKFIAMHDTSPPWGIEDDGTYGGNYSEYPVQIDRTKRGLWAAVVDFLQNHPEWIIKERRHNNNGFTVLQRSSQ